MPKYPLLFEAIGEIDSHECYLTVTGDKERDLPESLEDPMASFWLKPTGDESARSEWDALMYRFRDIAQDAGTDTKVIELFSSKRALLKKERVKGASIQVFWGLTTQGGVRRAICYALIPTK